MGVPQFFVLPDDLGSETAVVRGDDAYHAARVMRIRVGERLLLADGRGRVAAATATAVAPEALHARVEAIRHEPAPSPALTVVVGLLKTGKLDLTVQKLTELGVERIVPVTCQRSVVRWDDRKAAATRDRWASVARAAAKQAHRARVPEVAPVRPLAEALPDLPAPLVVCWEESERPLRGALPDPAPAALTLLIGPEGGLEDSEVEACRAVGGTDVSLGRLVLRAETAAIVATSMVGFHYDLLGTPPDAPVA